MTGSIDQARAFATANSDRFEAELLDLLRIPSLSGDPAFAPEMQRTAEWLVEDLKRLGADARVMPTPGHPVAYGEWLGAGPDKPTILVYGHYDVQPATLEDGWNTEPFEPTVIDGVVYARGATDDKGQLFIHSKALEAWLSTGSSPVNVKFLLEGEEEISSPNLAPFLREHADLLKADVCVISDTSMSTIEKPLIVHSLRGMTYFEISVRGPREDLHSGMWGGATHNPAVALVEILAKLYNPDGTIAIPGFYDDVAPLTDAERAMIAKTDLTPEEFMTATGIPAVWGDERFTIRERISARPTLDINGMWSGWTGPGPKTIIPASAGAKISSRLVANQDPHKIFDLVKAYIESIAPPTVQVELKLINVGMPALIPFDIAEMQAAARAYEAGWGYAPVFARGGGSIPIVSDIVDVLDIPVVMMGFGLDSDGLHAPNEHYRLDMFHRGIQTMIVYMDELARDAG